MNQRRLTITLVRAAEPQRALTRLLVLEHRRQCAAIAAGWFRFRVGPLEHRPEGYYEHPIVAASTGAVAREALRRPRAEPETQQMQEAREAGYLIDESEIRTGPTILP